MSALPTIVWHVQAYVDRKVDSELDSVGLAIYWLLIFWPVIPPLLLWYFISRRASRVAKWLLAVFVAYELLAAITNGLASTLEPSFFVTAIGVSCLDGGSLAMLFRRDSREWFDRKRRFGKADPATFD